MIRFLRLSPSRWALGYIALSVLVLALFAIPLWYAWNVNLATFKAYVDGEQTRKLVDVFGREGPNGLAAAIESHVGSVPGDEIIVLADPSKLPLAGNLPIWPVQVPDAPGTYGLVIDVGGGSTMRVVVLHVTLPGGYHLLMGRESVRFQSLIDYFWYGIAGATGIALILGAGIGWMNRRALLAEIQEISRAASAIVGGDLSRRLVTRGRSDELDTLARTVNGMLGQLATQNERLEGEIGVRRQAEQALHRAHNDLEGLVAQRTAELARTNDALRRSETYLAEAQKLSHTGSFGWNAASGELVWSDETYELVGLDRKTIPTIEQVLSRVHPEDAVLVQETFERAAREGGDVNLEHRFLTGDGSVKHVRVLARAVKDQSGELSYVGAVRDVTTEKSSEQALARAFQETRALQDQFRLALDTIPGLVWTALPDGHIDYLNQRWLEYTGLAIEHATGWGWQVAVHPQDLPALVEYWKSVLASGKPGETEARLRRFDGEYRWFLFRGVPLYDESGTLLKWYGTNTDIEDRKRAEAFLEGEKRLLEMIAKGNPLPATLDALCRHVEDISGGLLCSILLLDSSSGRMRHGAAPSLPESYVAATDGWPLTAGPCGMAASLGVPVVASNIAAEQRWHDYKALASAHGIGACWSTPIVSFEGKVLGTFAMLSREPGSPTPQHLNTIEQVTHIASIAIERKRAEEELQRQKAQLDELFDLAPDAIVLTDLRHPQIIRVNKEFTRVFGYAPEEAVGQRLRHLIVPNDMRPAALTENPDLLAGKKVEEEVVRQRKDGTHFHAHITAARVRLLDEEDAAYIIYRDITDRKEAEDKLRRSEAFLAEAQKISRTGSWAWVLSTGKVLWSEEQYRMLGFEPGDTEPSVDLFLSAVHPEDRTRVRQGLEEAARERKSYAIDYRVVLGNRSVRHLRSVGRPVVAEGGNVDEYIGVTTDVTERVRTEAALRARQEMLDLAQKAARALAFEWRLGLGEGENRWSPDLEAMYGLPAGSYDGTFDAWKKLVYPEDWPAVKEAIRRAYESGEVDAEYRVVHREGVVHWLQAKGRIMSDDSGQPERMVGFMLDVTERRQAEEELRRLEHQLRRAQRLEAMGTLAGGIAHDFNNILGAILGYGEMALRDAPRNGRLRRDLESITAAGERGRALVDRILAFSRSGVGERVAVNVDKVVRESLDLLMANLPSGITVKAELRAGRAAMQGDPTQVHQVVMNLATNGIQAMAPGGILRISLGTVRLDTQRIAATGTIAPGDYILLKVADSGDGIPAGILDRIFDPFFTTKEVGVGTGLGLSLVHGIVTEVGGAIDVETTLGAGSVFTVYLPHAGEVADGSADEEPDLPRGDRQRVLVVDDEAPLVRLTSETLEELGYDPVSFTSSASALEAFRADPKRFDAVITDERMPGLSGSALIREVRGIRRSIPILLVSGYVGGMVAGRAYNSGADEVLKKPLSARELAVTLARVLQLQSMSQK